MRHATGLRQIKISSKKSFKKSKRGTPCIRPSITHTGERKTAQCNFCAKTYYDSSTLKVHILIREKEKAHKCKICQKSFMQKNSLKTHTCTDTQDYSHKCTLCDYGVWLHHPFKMDRSTGFVSPTGEISAGQIFCCDTVFMIFCLLFYLYWAPPFSFSVFLTDICVFNMY